MSFTEAESKALLASALLVALAAVGRLLLEPPPARVAGENLSGTGRIDSVLAVAESAYAEVERRRKPLSADERIDPNRASEAELDRLPGIGPALARAIVQTRTEGGPFSSVEDLRRVPGIGGKKLEQLAAHTTLPRSAGRSAGGGTEAGRLGGSRGEGAGGRAGRGGRGGRLDLNRAGPTDLETLPGIGPARARAIVRWREAHGRFRKLEELLEVPGIGPATLERLRGVVSVGS